MESAEAAGVAGTPTLFINDIRYLGPRDLDSLDAAVRRVARMVESRAELALEEAAEADEASP